MYLQLAGEEDKKMTENWKGDADGILIFVSRRFACGSTATRTTNPEFGDRFILCSRRNPSHSVCAGPQAELSGHLSILPCKHLSDPRRFEWPPGPYPPHTFESAHTILPTNLCRVGQLALVP